MYPMDQLVPAAIQPAAIAVRPVAAATSCGPAAVALRLPAAAQVLLAKTLKPHAIVAGRRRLALFAATVCLFVTIVPVEIAYASEMWVSRTIAGIPIHFMLTGMVLLVAFANDSTYLLQVLRRPSVIFFAACLMLVVVVGFVRNGGNRYIIFADLYTIRWFFVGFMLMRLAIISGSLRQFLSAAAVVVLATSLRIDAKNTMGGEIDTTLVRASSNDLFTVMNLGTIVLALLVTVNWPRGVYHVAFCSAAFAMLIFLGGIRTSTRSLFAVQTLCFLLCLFALSRDPRMVGKGQGLRRAMVVVLLLTAVMLAYLVVKGQILGNVTQLGTRFEAETMVKHDTGAARVTEAIDMLQQLTPLEWAVGMGVGGMFFNTLGYWASVPHIAVLGWLQKGGLFILAVAFWALYIRPFVSFVAATAAPRRDAIVPPPILIVGPPLLAWASLTFISGGLDIGAFLGLGLLSALWMQLADDERRFTAVKAGRARASR